MCPAVPSVSGAVSLVEGAADGANHERDLVVGQRARVEQHPPVVDPRDHRRIAAAERPRQRFRIGVDRHHGPLELEQRQRPAADLGRRREITRRSLADRRRQPRRPRG